MNKNILAILEEKAPSFSKGQKRIARYILSDLQKAAFLTAGALGKETEVSESTVVRFATELGYDGFPQMQKAMHNALMDKLGNSKGGGISQNLEKESVGRTVQALSSAHRIYLVANGPETMLAEYMGACLERQFPDVHILTAGSQKLCHIGAEDTVIVFHFPLYSGETEKMAAACRNAGAKVIGITDKDHSPICPHCGDCLFVNAEIKPYGYSLLRPMALVEELLDALISGKDGCQ